MNCLTNGKTGGKDVYKRQENTQYQVGDTLTLPAGMRVLDGKTLEYGTMGLPGETFAPSGEMKVTITGIMDMEGVSDYPCYTAYGYIDRSEPFPDTNYKVRLLSLIHISHSQRV